MSVLPAAAARQATRPISGRNLAESLPDPRRWITCTPWYDLSQRALRGGGTSFGLREARRGQIIAKAETEKVDLVYMVIAFSRLVLET